MSETTLPTRGPDIRSRAEIRKDPTAIIEAIFSNLSDERRGYVLVDERRIREEITLKNVWARFMGYPGRYSVYQAHYEDDDFGLYRAAQAQEERELSDTPYEFGFQYSREGKGYYDISVSWTSLQRIPPKLCITVSQTTLLDEFHGKNRQMRVLLAKPLGVDKWEIVQAHRIFQDKKTYERQSEALDRPSQREEVLDAIVEAYECSSVFASGVDAKRKQDESPRHRRFGR